MSSPIDKIYADIFGQEPSKKGVALEKLSAIAMDILCEGSAVSHDQKIRGQFSKSIYQIDALSDDGVERIIGEVKDYTDRNAKVGRPDLQKLAGALPDLQNTKKGSFFSATGFTKPAQQYAANALSIVGKPITLFRLEPSVEADKNGTIQKIIIKAHFIIPNPDEGTFQPCITEAGRNKLLSSMPNGTTEQEISSEISDFYDKDGEPVESMLSLSTRLGFPGLNRETMIAKGKYDLKGLFIRINGELIEVVALNYEVPHTEKIQTIEITNDSKPIMTLKNLAGETISIMTEEKLKTYEFDLSGNLIKKAQ